MRVAVASFVVASLFCISACGDNENGEILVRVPAAWEAPVAEMIHRMPGANIRLERADAPASEAALTIELRDDAAIPAEGFQLAALPDDAGLTVAVHDLLGAQYGMAAALEAYGYRFRHPYDTYMPRLPELRSFDPEVQSPEVRVRGFQLHTLHPIEPYFAFYEPGEGNLEDAKRIIDWTIKNRGNYVQYVLLNRIIDDLEFRGKWIAHNKAIIEYAHARGVRTGVNIQLFGQANLQLAYDLSVDRIGMKTIAQEISERLPPIVNEGVRFDVYHLSFGEFFNAEPQKFVDAVNEVESQLHAMAPEAEMHGFVHVGAEQRLDYMGENLIYYFLVKYVMPNIVPDIHTVMFYNLFEDAGGAYHHDQFDEHLTYLRELMCSGKPHSYVPESAYWIAFDNSVPQFLPLYVRSRWLDLARLRETPGACGTLDQHILFSTGWEWGYWLQDVTTLRASYKVTKTPGELVDFQYAPDLGPDVSRVVNRAMEMQRDGLIQNRLAGYLAGRDAVIDIGDNGGIVSQPDRVTFDDLQKGLADIDVFEANVVADLEKYAAQMTSLHVSMSAFTPSPSRWARELHDGFRINMLRSQFVLNTYRATIAKLRGDVPAAERFHAEAKRLLDDARPLTQKRHGDLHDRHGRRLLDKTPNNTFYQYGYLYYADSLCFWQRELDQVRNVIAESMSPVPPSCFNF